MYTSFLYSLTPRCLDFTQGIAKRKDPQDPQVDATKSGWGVSKPNGFIRHQNMESSPPNIFIHSCLMIIRPTVWGLELAENSTSVAYSAKVCGVCVGPRAIHCHK